MQQSHNVGVHGFCGACYSFQFPLWCIPYNSVIWPCIWAFRIPIAFLEKKKKTALGVFPILQICGLFTAQPEDAIQTSHSKSSEYPGNEAKATECHINWAAALWRGRPLSQQLAVCDTWGKNQNWELVWLNLELFQTHKALGPVCLIFFLSGISILHFRAFQPSQSAHTWDKSPFCSGTGQS